MKKLITFFILLSIQSCSLFHAQEKHDLERVSNDVISNKFGKGIQMSLIPIEAKK